jgi:hypothetical protein
MEDAPAMAVSKPEWTVRINVYNGFNWTQIIHHCPYNWNQSTEIYGWFENSKIQRAFCSRCDGECPKEVIVGYWLLEM